VKCFILNTPLHMAGCQKTPTNLDDNVDHVSGLTSPSRPSISKVARVWPHDLIYAIFGSL
jgi:hypothetical protein